MKLIVFLKKRGVIMSKANDLMNKLEKTIGKSNMDKVKMAANKEAKKASDKIGDAVSKKIKGVDSEKVEKGINKYIDKYIK